MLEKRGEVDAASALYKRATQGRSALPQAHKNLADQGPSLEDTEGARAQYEKAMKLGDDVCLRLGTMPYQSNERDVALLLWRRAQDMNPYNAAVKANREMLAGE